MHRWLLISHFGFCDNETELCPKIYVTSVVNDQEKGTRSVLKGSVGF